MKHTSSALAGLLSFIFSGIALASSYGGELVAPVGTFPNNHASTVVRTDAGLVTCWFAGPEASREVRIVCSTRDDESATWFPPRDAVSPGERADGQLLSNKFVGNPVLYRHYDGMLWLFYEAVQIGGHSGAAVHFKTSADQAQTWSPSRLLAGGFGDFGHLPRNKPLLLDDGRIMLPLYREFTSHYGYTLTLTLRGRDVASSEKHVIPGEGHLQPSLVRRPDGEILAYLRHKGTGPVLVSAWDGAAWGPPLETNLPNPDAAVDSTVDATGRVWLVYNDSLSSRNPLSLAASDDGRIFRKVVDLENDPESSFAYPAFFRDADGLYHVTYSYRGGSTIKHVFFDEGWLNR